MVEPVGSCLRFETAFRKCQWASHCRNVTVATLRCSCCSLAVTHNPRLGGFAWYTTSFTRMRQCSERKCSGAFRSCTVSLPMGRYGKNRMERQVRSR